MSNIERRLLHFQFNNYGVIDTENHYTVSKIAAQVADMTDKVVCGAIIDEAEQAGVTDLYLIDRDFIRAAIKKQIPKKPKDYPFSAGQCPSCDAVFEFDWEPKSKYCQNCGQKLNWESEVETERGETLAK